MEIIMLNLQAFAEGAAAAAATGADGANAPGMVAASDAGEESGQTRDYDAELDSLIKGEYKEAFTGAKIKTPYEITLAPGEYMVLTK